MPGNKQRPATPKVGQADPVSMPVFFRDPMPLDSRRHAKASVRTCDFAFAIQTNSVPIVLEEFFDAARHYPIVFSMGELPSPLAILGLERTNYFITREGSWEPHHYIPAYVRQYPFIFLEQTNEDRLYLAIDEAAPHFGNTVQAGASALYTEDGKPTPTTDNALNFCSALYAQHKATRQLGEWLKSNNLLVPSQSDAEFASGKVLKLEGFQIIDERAFNLLPEKPLLELRNKGWLSAIYIALAATSNWQHLLKQAEIQSNTAA
jgi:hypothetical protein